MGNGETGPLILNMPAQQKRNLLSLVLGKNRGTITGMANISIASDLNVIDSETASDHKGEPNTWRAGVLMENNKGQLAISLCP
jgi:hypothetical protein